MYVCRELGVCRLPWFLDKHEAEKTKFAQKKGFIKGILHLEIHFFCFYPKHYLGLPKHWIQFGFLLERIDLWECTGFWEWKKTQRTWKIMKPNAPAKPPAKRSKSEISAWQWLEPSKYWYIRSHFVCMRSGVEVLVPQAPRMSRSWRWCHRLQVPPPRQEVQDLPLRLDCLFGAKCQSQVSSADSRHLEKTRQALASLHHIFE